MSITTTEEKELSKAKHKPSLFVAVLAIIAILALFAVPLLVVHQHTHPHNPRNETGILEEQESQDPAKDAALQGFVKNSTGSQVTYLRLSDGYHTGTATERFARPALSLIKLYIADYVIKHGTMKEKYEALNMVRSSNDAYAEELYSRYPDSIEETAKEYGLYSTRGDEMWGYSVTSTYDVVKFISELIKEDPTNPILVAMADANPVAADGYQQNFGTSVLPGVIGTKWGWSNDLALHSSVSFGEDFVVAAAVTGSASDLTSLVKEQLGDMKDFQKEEAEAN